jgi:hypothetical protein
MNKILKIINEEIDKVISESLGDVSILLEQDPNAAPPAAPPAAPGAVAGAPPAPAAPGAVPAVPAAPGATGAPQEEDKDLEALKKKIKGSKDDLEIKKHLQSDFQGKKEQKVQELYSKMISDKDLEDKKVAVNKFMHQFFPEIYKKINKIDTSKTTAPVQVNAIPAIVKESKLQKSIKEYLHYKRLYNQTGDE